MAEKRVTKAERVIAARLVSETGTVIHCEKEGKAGDFFNVFLSFFEKRYKIKQLKTEEIYRSIPKKGLFKSFAPIPPIINAGPPHKKQLFKRIASLSEISPFITAFLD